MDDLGIDVLLAGVQKALALPPGLAVFAVSPAAFERAEQMKNRGYYFDFLEFRKAGEGNNTPSTPSIPHIYGLASKLEDIEQEGLANRYHRHKQLNEMTQDWLKKQGLTNFSQKGFESKTLTTIDNLDKKVDVSGLIAELRKKHGFLINGGYGKIKGITWRISNMGDETAATMTELFNALDDVFPKHLRN